MMTEEMPLEPADDGIGSNGREKTIVLIVDDDYDARQILGKMFGHRGHQVLLACNFDEALDAIHGVGEKAIIAFIDNHLGMPGKDGIDLIRYINQTVKHRVYPYMWTADTSAETSIKAIEAGTIGPPLKKPMTDSSELLAIVEKSDIQDRLRATERDPQTGLYSYGTFTDIVSSEMKTASARGHPIVFSIILIDLDHLKELNDTKGYVVGDKVLKRISLYLKEHLRPSDYVCRSGGDEFLVWLADMHQETAYQIGKKLQNGASELIVDGGSAGNIKFTLSFGVAELRRGDIDADNPIKSLESLREMADLGPLGMKIGRVARGYKGRQ